jgi:hypothetical protein
MINRSLRRVLLKGIGNRLLLWGRLLLRQTEEHPPTRGLSARARPPARPQTPTTDRGIPFFAEAEADMSPQQTAGPPAHWLEMVTPAGPPAHWLEKLQQSTTTPIGIEGKAEGPEAIPTPPRTPASETPLRPRYGPDHVREDLRQPTAKRLSERAAGGFAATSARIERGQQAPATSARLQDRAAEAPGPKRERRASGPISRFRQIAGRPFRRWQAFVSRNEALLRRDSGKLIRRADEVRTEVISTPGAQAWPYATREPRIEDAATTQSSSRRSYKHRTGQVQAGQARAVQRTIRSREMAAPAEAESEAPSARPRYFQSRHAPHYPRLNPGRRNNGEAVPPREGMRRNHLPHLYESNEAQSREIRQAQTEWTPGKQATRLGKSRPSYAGPHYMRRQRPDSPQLEMPGAVRTSKGRGREKTASKDHIDLWPALPETAGPELEIEDEAIAGGNREATYLLWERRRRLDNEQKGLRWSV